MKQVKRFWPVAALVALCLAGLCVGVIWRARQPYRWKPDHFSEPALVALQERICPDWEKYGIVLTGMDKWHNRTNVYVRDKSFIASAEAALTKKFPADSFLVKDGIFLFSESSVDQIAAVMATATALYGYYDEYGVSLAAWDIFLKRVYVFLSDISKESEVRAAIQTIVPTSWLYFADGSYIVRRDPKYTLEELSLFGQVIQAQPETKAQFGATYGYTDRENNYFCFAIDDLSRAHELAEYVTQYIPADSFYFIEAAQLQES